jgi:hypothetical protein
VTRITGALATFSEGLGRIEGVLSRAAADASQPATLAEVTTERLEKIIAGLRAVPVEVEIKVVPVYEDQKAAPPAPEKPAAKKGKTFSGKEKQLPVDIETSVDQGEAGS